MGCLPSTGAGFSIHGIHGIDGKTANRGTDRSGFRRLHSSSSAAARNLVKLKGSEAPLLVEAWGFCPGESRVAEWVQNLIQFWPEIPAISTNKTPFIDIYRMYNPIYNQL